MKRIFGAILGLSLLSGCSGTDLSNANPMNWFNRDQPRPVVSATEEAIFVETRELLPEVTEVSQEPISNGIVLLAKGLPPTQGFWSPVLVPTNDEQPLDGILTYELRATGPTDIVVEGTEDSRELQAARIITADKLEGVSGIRVIALANHVDVDVEG